MLVGYETYCACGSECYLEISICCGCDLSVKNVRVVKLAGKEWVYMYTT